MTDQATKHAIISARIRNEIAGGATVGQAIDAVIGEGTYDALVSDLYRSLRQKAGVP